MTVSGKNHLVVPYTMDANDAKYSSPAGFSTGDDFFSYLKATFDQLYEEGLNKPKIMSVGLHARISGRPGRARALAAFLDPPLDAGTPSSIALMLLTPGCLDLKRCSLPKGLRIKCSECLFKVRETMGCSTDPCM